MIDAMTGSKTISIILPVYCNADTLQELYTRLLHVMEEQSWNWQIIFINDACPQNSSVVLKLIADKDQRVMIIDHTTNLGQHQAVMEGLAVARGDWSVIMDSDLQDPPEAILRLIRRGEEGFAAVFAGRRGRYESAGRLLTSKIAKRTLRLLTGLPIDAGLFVAVNAAMRRKLLSMPAGTPSVVVMIGCAEMPVDSLPVERNSRPSGNTAYTTWRRMKIGWGAVSWALKWRWQKMRQN